MTLRGIIFDIDGTLIDSVDVRVRRLIGMGGDTLLPEVIGK